MTYPATRNRLGGRLAVARLIGTALGVFIISLADPSRFSPAWWTGVRLVLLVALLFGISGFSLAALVLLNFKASVLHRPACWCLGLPGVLLALALLLPASGGVHWLVVMAFCAVLAGVVFLIWQLRRPMTLPK